ncbi:MAG: hypothetical protein II179_01090 [Alphaproteobacteria bacterium]|nr:hypothetical protein [Alphaproteobacteria bacterium]
MTNEPNILDKMEKLEELRRSHLNALRYIIEYREDNISSSRLKKETGRGNSFFESRFTYIFVRPSINGLNEDPLTVVQTIYKLYGIETKKHTTHLDDIEREILYVVQPYDQLSDEQRKFLNESCSSKSEIMNTLSEIITQMPKQPENNFSFHNPGINR